jgi:hypothetical protein
VVRLDGSVWEVKRGEKEKELREIEGEHEWEVKLGVIRVGFAGKRLESLRVIQIAFGRLERVQVGFHWEMENGHVKETIEVGFECEVKWEVLRKLLVEFEQVVVKIEGRLCGVQFGFECEKEQAEGRKIVAGFEWREERMWAGKWLQQGKEVEVEMKQQ